MSGLEKIIKEIKSESQTECESIIAEAKKAAAETVARAEKAAEGIAKTAQERAQAEDARITDRAESDGKLGMSRKKLEFRQQIIGEIIAEAKKRIIAMDDKAYFEIMSKLLKSTARPEEGRLIITDRDMSRMSSEFKKCIKQHSLEVSATLDADDGGFILVYGDTVENCSIKALIDAKYESLTDTVNSILF